SPPSSPSPSSIVQASVVVSLCMACKILEKCILAPYFPPSQSFKFTIAHRIFSTSNIIKLLL
ncbi:hypothetical protein Csa_008335, partial [Cucumis sativus]